MATRGGILVGFEGPFDPVGISEKGYDTAIQQQNQNERMGLERQREGRAEEKQTWERALQPLKMQEAMTAVRHREQLVEEADRKVRQQQDAQDEFRKLSERFGTDNPPKAQEILVTSARMHAAKGNFSEATQSLSDLRRMMENEDERADIEGFIEQTSPLIYEGHSKGWSPELAQRLADVQKKHPRALKTGAWTTFQNQLNKIYDETLPPAAAEAMVNYRIAVGQGKEPVKAWNDALAANSDALNYFARNPKHVPDRINDQAYLAAQEKGRLEREAEKDKRRAELQTKLQEMRNKAREEDRQMRLQLQKARQGGKPGDALKIINGQVALVAKELKRQQGLLKDEMDPDKRAGIQAVISYYEERHDRLMDASDQLSAEKVEGATAAPPAATPPAGTEPAAPPTLVKPPRGAAGAEEGTAREAGDYAVKKSEIDRTIRAASSKKGKGFDYDATVKDLIDRLVQAKQLEPKQALRLYEGFIKDTQHPLNPRNPKNKK